MRDSSARRPVNFICLYSTIQSNTTIMIESMILRILKRSKESFSMEEYNMDRYWAYRVAIEVCIFLLSVYAAYLSWTCNEALGYSTVVRAIFAFIAFVFGIFYVIFYAIFRSDACSTVIGRTKGEMSKK